MQLAIHDVVEVSVVEVTEWDEPHEFASRAIQIFDDKGNMYEITLFSETKKQLELKHITRGGIPIQTEVKATIGEPVVI
jgi:hypothetical protein